MRAIDRVHYQGVHWRDIDWDLPVHEMTTCDCCGADGAEGHLSACRYLFANQESPAGEAFVREKIREALAREGRLPDHAPA